MKIRMMKNQLFAKTGFMPRRAVFVQLGESGKYQEFEAVSQKTSAKDWKTQNEGQDAIYQAAGEAETDYKKLETEAKGKLVKPTVPPDSASAADKDKYRQDLDKYNIEKSKIETEAASSYRQIWALRDAATAQLIASFQARENVRKDIKERTINELAEMDSEDQADIKKRADFAADLADDGIITSLRKDEINDYIGSKLDEKDPEEINDSDIEDITMGIAARLHDANKESENKDTNPARIFMKGLSDREQNRETADADTDVGVKISDVRMQTLANMGFDVSDADKREKAVKSPAGQLMSEIIKDKEMAPQLRGMFVGELAKCKTPEEREAAVKRIRSMYTNARTLMQERGRGTGKDAQSFGAAGWRWFWTGDFDLGLDTSDSNALQKSAVVFQHLERMEKVSAFQDVVGEYEGFKAISGVKAVPEVDKIIKESETPGDMSDNLEKLRTAINAAKEKYMADEIAKIKASDDYKKTQDLYKFYKLEANFPVKDADIAGLKGKDLANFKAGLEGIKGKIDGAKNSPALAAAAETIKNDTNTAIRTIKAYQAKYEKYKSNANVTALPTITNQYGADVSGKTPEEIKASVEKYPAVAADYKIVHDNGSGLDAAIASKPRSTGGGGGGEVATGGGAGGGGRTAPAEGGGAGGEVAGGVKVEGIRGDTNLDSTYGVDPGKKDAKPENNPPTWVKQEEPKIKAGDYNKKDGNVMTVYTNYAVQRGNDTYVARVGDGGKISYYKATKQPPTPNANS